jgi:hypothetical protein
VNVAAENQARPCPFGFKLRLPCSPPSKTQASPSLETRLLRPARGPAVAAIHWRVRYPVTMLQQRKQDHQGPANLGTQHLCSKVASTTIRRTIYQGHRFGLLGSYLSRQPQLILSREIFFFWSPRKQSIPTTPDAPDCPNTDTAVPSPAQSFSKPQTLER